MKNVMTGICKEVPGIMRKSIGRIFTTHLAYAALGVLLFAPLVGVIGRLLLYRSGQPALADQDIVYFLLTPFGMAALILFAALLIAILAFEQASLMTISALPFRGCTLAQCRRCLSQLGGRRVSSRSQFAWLRGYWSSRCHSSPPAGLSPGC